MSKLISNTYPTGYPRGAGVPLERSVILQAGAFGVGKTSGLKFDGSGLRLLGFGVELWHPAAGCQRDEGHHSGRKVPQLHAADTSLSLWGSREWTSTAQPQAPVEPLQCRNQDLAGFFNSIAKPQFLSAWRITLEFYRQRHGTVSSRTRFSQSICPSVLAVVSRLRGLE